MSLEDFWINVRSACIRFNRDFQIDRPFLNRGEILAKLRENDFWFRKRSVAGFNEADFDFLDESSQANLAKIVEEFRSLAPNSPSKSPATNPDMKKEIAMDLFADIVLTLEYGRYGNAEGLRLGKLIEKELDPSPPQGVADLRFDAGADHSGDPAIWIWVFIDRDSSQTDDQFLARAQEVRDLIDPIARRVCGERWPFFRMLSVDDMSDAVDLAHPAADARP